MVVRQATARDAEEIARLQIASWQATYVNELPADFLATQDLAARTEGWQCQIEQGTEVLLAEEDGRLVGFVACGPARYGGSQEPREWQIYNLHSAPSRHGRGIGSVLFERAVRLGRAWGARDLMLWVVRTNTTARTFYEHRGMRPDGVEQEGHIAPGIFLDEIRYRMNLADTCRS